MKNWQKEYLKELSIPATKQNLSLFENTLSYKFEELKQSFVSLGKSFININSDEVNFYLGYIFFIMFISMIVYTLNLFIKFL